VPSQHRSITVVVFCLLLWGAASAAEPARPRPLEADEVARLEPVKLKALLQRSQDTVEVTPQLDGVWIGDGRLDAADEQRIRRLTLTGRVRQESQRALVVQVLGNVLQEESFWATSDEEIVVSAEAMQVAQPLVDLGKKHYSLAIDRFFASQYEEADALFTRALVEDAQREVIHYWKVAGAIALKQTARAERRLDVLLRRHPAGSRDHAAQMERLQGPLRQSLMQMEQRVLLKVRGGPP
jgi:hypothetical protein